MCPLLPEDLHSDLTLSLLHMVFGRVAAVKQLPVHHLSADYIFPGSFGIIELIPCQIENRLPLKPVLGGVGSVAP